MLEHRIPEPSCLSRWLVPILFLFALPAASHAQCNTSPTAVDDVALHIGEILIVDVLANDLEPDGEALTAQPAMFPLHISREI